MASLTKHPAEECGSSMHQFSCISKAINFRRTDSFCYFELTVTFEGKKSIYCLFRYPSTYFVLLLGGRRPNRIKHSIDLAGQFKTLALRLPRDQQVPTLGLEGRGKISLWNLHSVLQLNLSLKQLCFLACPTYDQVNLYSVHHWFDQRTSCFNATLWSGTSLSWALCQLKLCMPINVVKIPSLFLCCFRRNHLVNLWLGCLLHSRQRRELASNRNLVWATGTQWKGNADSFSVGIYGKSCHQGVQRLHLLWAGDATFVLLRCISRIRVFSEMPSQQSVARVKRTLWTTLYV